VLELWLFEHLLYLYLPLWGFLWHFIEVMILIEHSDPDWLAYVVNHLLNPALFQSFHHQIHHLFLSSLLLKLQHPLNLQYAQELLQTCVYSFQALTISQNQVPFNHDFDRQRSH